MQAVLEAVHGIGSHSSAASHRAVFEDKTGILGTVGFLLHCLPVLLKDRLIMVNGKH